MSMMQIRSGLGLIIIGIFLTGCGPVPAIPAPRTTDPSPAHALYAGGSNYNWYQVDANCARDAYGVIAQYHLAKPAIDAQLLAMYRVGQRRLRLTLYHWDGYTYVNNERVLWAGAASGTLLLTGPDGLDRQALENLYNLLTTMKQIGYEQVVVTMGPQGANNLGTWPNGIWQEQEYGENWQALVQVRQVLMAAQLPYWLDLLDEGMPSKEWTFYNTMRAYSRRVWQEYVRDFGAADTLGVSMVASVAVAREVAGVYEVNGVYPAVYDLHFYAEQGAQDLFRQVDEELGGVQGDRRPWIIGEAYYDNAAEARALQAGMVEAGRGVEWVAQWPVTPSALQAGCQVDVAPPVEWSGWEGEGF